MKTDDTGFDDMPTIEFGDEPTLVGDKPTLVGFDEVPTVVQQQPIRMEALDPSAAEPPALPFTLMRRKHGRADWMASLPIPARRVLERAKLSAPGWPVAPRLSGAVAVPVDAFEDADTEVN